MIIQKNKLVNSNLGSSLMSPANGLGGSRATILFLFSFLKAAAAPALRALKQAGKKEGGWGEGIFARLRFPRRRRGWGGSVSAIPPKAEYQNRKIFFSLIEKIFWGARLKNVEKIFLFCSPKRSGGGRKRWAGFNPQNPLDFAQKRFGFRPNSTANLQFQRFGRCLPRGFAARLARCARKGLILKGFATLRAAKRKCFGFGLESSFWRSQKQNEVLPTNLFLFRL